MSESPAKSPPSLNSGEQQQVNTAQYNGQHSGAAAYTAGGGYPPFYTYPPPPSDANGQGGDPNATNGAPSGAYLMAFPSPPGMIYAYPPAQGFPFGPGVPIPAALMRPKRKQVKMACTNCAAACKRCDEARPCERCIKYNIADSCTDGVRKERKKGVKRGPYKRKGKYQEGNYEAFSAEAGPSEEWHQQSATTAGYYPYFYPAPGFVPIGPDGQPIQPDGTNGMNASHPQYFPLHPAYPPYGPYSHVPPGGAFPQGVAPSQMQLQPPVSSTESADDQGKSTNKGKKRARSNKEDNEFSPKLKKARTTTKSLSGSLSSTAKRAGRKSVHEAAINDGQSVEKPDGPSIVGEAATADPQDLSV